jgi:uncharacterized damage-inducible protein DinB
MTISQALLPEFDHEMANTRKSLERIPDDKFNWSPHPKSPTLGWLASHLSSLPHWTSVAMENDSLDLAPPGAPPAREPEPRSRQEILARFDKNVADARAALVRASDTHLQSPWTLLKGGKTIMTLPRVAVVRSFVMNHMIHHRAQLGVYFRLNNIPVPALYGPSADEGAM